MKLRGKPFGFLYPFIFRDLENDKYLVYIDSKAVILPFFRNLQLFCSASSEPVTNGREICEVER